MQLRPRACHETSMSTSMFAVCVDRTGRSLSGDQMKQIQPSKELMMTEWGDLIQSNTINKSKTHITSARETKRTRCSNFSSRV